MTGTDPGFQNTSYVVFRNFIDIKSTIYVHHIRTRVVEIFDFFLNKFQFEIA